MENFEKRKIIESISKCDSVMPSRIINGYYVRTIFVKELYSKEVVIKVLAVFKDENDCEILQYNVDVENLFGTLLTSDAYTPDDIQCVADGVIKFISVSNGGK